MPLKGVISIYIPTMLAILFLRSTIFISERYLDIATIVAMNDTISTTKRPFNTSTQGISKMIPRIRPPKPQTPNLDPQSPYASFPRPVPSRPHPPPLPFLAPYSKES